MLRGLIFYLLVTGEKLLHEIFIPNSFNCILHKKATKGKNFEDTTAPSL
jgi:hypothetical protein